MASDRQDLAVSVSIVIYRSEQQLLLQVIDALAASLEAAGVAAGLVLVDNHDQQQGAHIAALLDERAGPKFSQVRVLAGHGNVGYGRGHNLAIAQSNAPLHLILNPDAILSADAMSEALQFLESHQDVVLLAPGVYGDDGKLQYLCRRYPTVFDLFLRGFAPSAVRARFALRLARYQMQDVINAHEVVFDPPIISGCFMLFRSSALKRVAGFDSRYFLYFEDYDLSLRAGALGRIAYVPDVRIVHLGGNAARKGLRHIKLFLSSATLFFRLHGWRWW